MDGKLCVRGTFLFYLLVFHCYSFGSMCACNDTDRFDKLEAKVQLLEHHLEVLKQSLDNTLVNDNTQWAVQKDNPGSTQNYFADLLNVDKTLQESAFDVTMSPVANQDEKVAFYGRILSQYTIVPGQGQVLVFEDVVTNSGNHYSKYTGIFTVPFNGYYVFSWSIVTRHSGIFTQIVVNSVEKGGILSHSTSTDDYVTVTGVVVIYILKGDVVFIRTHPSNNVRGDITSYSDQHSSFMGWKL